MTADEVYGGDARLRAWLEEHDLAYVLTIKATQPLWAAGEQSPAELPARQLLAASRPRLAAPERRGWRQGPGLDWARITLIRPGWPGRGFWLLARRRLTDGEQAFCVCFGPASLGGWPGPRRRSSSSSMVTYSAMTRPSR
jgi:hypothetical protein